MVRRVTSIFRHSGSNSEMFGWFDQGCHAELNMKIKIMRIVACAGLLLLARAVVAAPSVPAALNYQGRLQPDQGVLAAGPYGLQFRFWSAPTGGTQLWARAFSSVYVASNGVFNATLTDAGTELLIPPQASDLLAAFAGGPVYLGITVVQTPSGSVPSPLQITPVRQFLSAPYCVTAHWCEDAHNLLNATNLLSRGGGNWPPDSLYAIALNPGSPITGSPLAGVVEARPNGLWANAPVTFKGVLQASELIVNSLSSTNGTIVFGSVRMLQPAGQPSGNIFYYGYNATFSIAVAAPQDGLLALTVPPSQGGYYTISVEYGSQTQITITPTSMTPANVAGVQAVRLIPVKAGQSITISSKNGQSGSVAFTYQFLPFGAAL